MDLPVALTLLAIALITWREMIPPYGILSSPAALESRTLRNDRPSLTTFASSGRGASTPDLTPSTRARMAQRGTPTVTVGGVGSVAFA